MDGVRGRLVSLRPATDADLEVLVAIRSTPEVSERWGTDDIADDVAEAIGEQDLHYWCIDVDGRVVGAIQWWEEPDPMYRHATIDVFVDPAVHGQGIGTDAVRAVATHLVDVRGHHRIPIDPAADNAAAIRCYEKVGFRRVGVMRRYERGPDGTWHDGVLMDLLADELIR